ncbi:TetR/AcrR family transcriptional regulator [Pseudonocardia asaccharolytica]|uniref:TetR family transcriptional regulator n=1 Tax=Pseudonocardia asaccharolytica DSM 44247 = NBRC 16224 TaxID=1123024 RepID=A0A511D160_9PSEU|nr:TetR/AcrR family transcriptional regulator [Pseudonocardia asaccharolytica]GEL18273.1 TetR family transcriptional regulator [Pseudonocardia asaccharolytica DSM 44247 = NBRC 16224]
MPARVNTPDGARPRGRQVARTEQRIIEAATRLFVADGYVATTLGAVAEAAGVGERTVYVRFGSKAALLERVVDVAIVGDTDEVDVLGRDWVQTALTAPTATDRINALAAATRQIMDRAGALFAVAQQAAAIEPLIAGQWQQGREQSRHAQRVVWTRMAADGLIADSRDLDRLIDTASVLTGAETYLLITRMFGWPLDTYEAWLRDTLTRLIASPGATGTGPAGRAGT